MQPCPQQSGPFRAGCANLERQTQGIDRQSDTNTIVQGKVTNITNFGVSSIWAEWKVWFTFRNSPGRVRRPEDYARMGETISVLILSVDTRRCTLPDIKRLNPNPWSSWSVNINPGYRNREGLKILPYGALRNWKRRGRPDPYSTLEMNDKLRT